jgi:5-methyltetrahydrofolate--homocysteine methyltransferase
MCAKMSHGMNKTAQLEDLLRRRIVIIDGAMGTMIYAHKLDERAVRGERFKSWHRDVKNLTDLLNLTRPDIIEAIHREYLEAGADIIKTNTFNAQSIRSHWRTMKCSLWLTTWPKPAQSSLVAP